MYTISVDIKIQLNIYVRCMVGQGGKINTSENI